MRSVAAALVLLFGLLVAVTDPAIAQEERTLQSDGLERSFLLVGATPGMPRPLILALHGNGGSGEQFLRYGPWLPLVASAGVVLALPDGLNRSWADGRPDSEFRGRKPPAGLNDVAFLTSLVNDLVKAGIADRKRIYVAGLSNGGMMALRLLCDRADLFAAGAVVIASLPESSSTRCKPSRPVPLLLMNGTADKLVPDQAVPGQFLGTEGTAAFWRRVNRCGAMRTAQDLPDINPNDGSRVTLSEAPCPPGQDVAVYRVVGGGHQMPTITGPALLERMLGPRNRDIEGAEVIWSFLRKFTR
jgi:polyhydroxybutyrate depolymerase